MSEAAWFLLAVTLFAGAASPGPSLALVLRSTLIGGRSAGLMVGLAHGFGVWLYALAVVFGVATVLLHNHWAMFLVQSLGVIFLCYLGSQMIRGSLGHLMHDASIKNEPASIKPAGRPLRDGFLIVFLNPKIMIFFFAVFSQFLTADQTLATQVAAATLAGLIDGLWYSLVVLLLSFGPFDEFLRRYSGGIEMTFGVILLAIAMTILAGLVLD